jgi:hypothetical protein
MAMARGAVSRWIGTSQSGATGYHCGGKEQTPADPVTFMAALAFAATALLVTAVPAHRAARTDPMEAIRADGMNRSARLRQSIRFEPKIRA